MLSQFIQAFTKRPVGWVWTPAFAIYGVGIGGQYQVFRQAWEQMMLPSLPDPYPWPWATVFVLALFILAFAYRDIRERYAAPRIIFSDPYVEKVPHGKELEDGTVDFSDGVEQYHISINVRNDPISHTAGNDLEEAWTRLVVFDPNKFQETQQIDGCRWEQNEKPRMDYGETERKRRFREEWTRRRLIANRQKHTINFGLKTLYSSFFYGFQASDQEKENFTTRPYSDWINENHRVPQNKFFCCIEVRGKIGHPFRYFMQVETSDSDLEKPPEVVPVSKKACKTVLEFREGKYG